jgi:hypothetical protein
MLALAAPSCGKVPIHDVEAAFLVADVAWFAEEETLFAFYDVRAEQGISENSVIEITYSTDQERVDWTRLSDFSPVHTHLSVDCGANGLCGSTSLHVVDEPREVALRMRYHRDSELALESETVFNVVGYGDPHSNRSLLVYGVFDETNQRVQWRGRNQFPALRNEEATAFGLRRWFQVQDQGYGTAPLSTRDNPYGYGARCPKGFTDAGLAPVETRERAVFDASDLPIEASAHAVVCASSTVQDATGTFTTGALAQKNPEVRAAFPELRSPIRETTVLPFFLEPCDRTISKEHEQMQRQRLLVGRLPPICIDDWEEPDFEDSLIVAFTDAVEAARPDGKDMVLVVGLHQDEAGVSELVESALSSIVPEERHRASPRLAGAFVFDSATYGIAGSELGPSTLWCPASILGAGDSVDASLMACAVAPDSQQIDLGPFTFGMLPILPPRDQYLEFIETFSEAQAGEVLSYEIRAPEFSATSDHIDVGDYGVATFLNNELISAEIEDAFSYCTTLSPYVFLFRSELLQSEDVQKVIEAQCLSGALPADLCSVVTLGLLPINYLPLWHQQFRERSYDLGLLWDFPFLLHVEYETVIAGSVTAFGFSVPFGLGQTGEQYMGSTVWTTEIFSLEKELTQCTRFCVHPTFDSAGVYHITDPFSTTYPTSCYVPRYPMLGDSGYPLDP